MEPPWSRLVAGLVLGSEAFVERLRRELRGNRGEQTELRRLERGTSWSQIVEAVEASKGESWEQFHLRHGDWGRDAVLWLGRQVGRLSLRELGKSAGMDYPAVSQAVVRFDKRIERDTTLRRQLTKIRNEITAVPQFSQKKCWIDSVTLPQGRDEKTQNQSNTVQNEHSPPSLQSHSAA